METKIWSAGSLIEPLPFCILPPATPSASNVFFARTPRHPPPLPSSPPSVPSRPAQTQTKIPCPLGLRPGSAPPPPWSPVDAPSNRRRRRAPRSAGAVPLLFALQPPTVRGSTRRSYSRRTGTRRRTARARLQRSRPASGEGRPVQRRWPGRRAGDQDFWRPFCLFFGDDCCGADCCVCAAIV
jgi:hypothetical protein